MALFKCPECGEEISDQSKQCIYCGKSLNKKLITTKKDSIYYCMYLFSYIDCVIL